PQLPGPIRLVPPRRTLLGLEWHGVDHDPAPDPGLPLGGLQVSARVDLDRRRVPLSRYPGHGLQRPDLALGSGCLLGTGDWRRYRWPDAIDRTAGGGVAPGGTDHRRQNPVTLFRASCLCDPRGADWPGRLASLVGAAAGCQRMADTGS